MELWWLKKAKKGREKSTEVACANLANLGFWAPTGETKGLRFELRWVQSSQKPNQNTTQHNTQKAQDNYLHAQTVHKKGTPTVRFLLPTLCLARQSHSFLPSPLSFFYLPHLFLIPPQPLFTLLRHTPFFFFFSHSCFHFHHHSGGAPRSGATTTTTTTKLCPHTTGSNANALSFTPPSLSGKRVSLNSNSRLSLRCSSFSSPDYTSCCCWWYWLDGSIC